MKKLYSWEKLIFVASAGVIVLLSLLGFYLVKAEIPEAYEHLVKAGHSHGLCFSFAAIFYAILLKRVILSQKLKTYLGYWVLITFLGPFGLLFAGLSHKMNFLALTSIIGEGSFVLIWAIMTFLLFTRFNQEKISL